MLPSIKEAQAHLAETGDPLVLDAASLRSEADFSPEIHLRIITNKIKKDGTEGTSKKKKVSNDPMSHDLDKSPVVERENFNEQQEYSVKRSNDCDVAEGNCQFVQVNINEDNNRNDNDNDFDAYHDTYDTYIYFVCVDVFSK